MASRRILNSFALCTLTRSFEGLMIITLVAAFLASAFWATSAIADSRTDLPMIMMQNSPPEEALTQSSVDERLAPDASQKVMLPFVYGQSTQITSEQFEVGYSLESNISALGGRVAIHLPLHALSRNMCTLTVVSPDPQAAWLEAYVYIICGSGGPNEEYMTEMYQPMSISLDYSKADLTYVDETRLTLASSPSYDWAPEIGGWRPLPEAASVDGDKIWQIGVDTAKKRVILNANRSFIVTRVDVGYAISEMASAPGGQVYAAARPVIYRVGTGGKLNRLANLEDVPGGSAIARQFAHFTVNPSSGEIYLTAGSKVYSLKNNVLSELYAVEAGEELGPLAYRTQDGTLYLAISKIQESWFGCPIRNSWVRAIKPKDGSVYGSVRVNSPYIHAISALTVDSTGRLLLTQSMASCNPNGYSGTWLLTGTTTDRLPKFGTYPGFRGAYYLASDEQGRTFVSNTTADMVSVVSGASSELAGYLSAADPGPIAVSNDTLFILSNGKITTHSLSGISSGGGAAEIANSTLSGAVEVHVTAPAFSPIPAHNVLYYNGVRHFISESDEQSYTGQEAELKYSVTVPQPAPVAYKPLTNQKAAIVFKTNGAKTSSTNIVAPETPYEEWQFSATEPNRRIAQYRWVRLVFVGTLTSQEGLFPEIPAYGKVVRTVFIQFRQQGQFHFTNQEEGQSERQLTVEVDAYGDVGVTTSLTVDPAKGAVVWRGGAAFEIPAGALPAHSGGYKVYFSTKQNSLTLKDTVSDRSPVYNFSIAPEVLKLNQALTLHIPRVAKDPIMAFYDPMLDDAYTIPFSADPSSSTHVLLTLPAGSYPSSEVESADSIAAGAILPAQVDASWLRRGLNWLGGTGIWHAVGLPNDKIVTDHFVILFNKNDCSSAYAGVVLDALENAYQTFSTEGAIMPSTAVYVKLSTWAASKSKPGKTPGIGSLFNFYMFLYAKLSTEALQDTAVHEYMHVLQKTNALADGRYLNPTWWEEATAIWAQYHLYPSHSTYYYDIVGVGECWLRNGYSQWNSMGTAEMYAAMSLAEYLNQNYGATAVFKTFQEMGLGTDGVTGVQKSIEKVTSQKFGDFYEEFAKEYWLQTFEPVKSWMFLDNMPGTSAILKVEMNHAVNPVVSRGNIPQLSSGLLKVYAINPMPVSFTEDPELETGSVARVANSCTGMSFNFYDAQRSEISALSFSGQPEAGQDEAYYDKKLGSIIKSKPVYVLYIDKSYGYDAACSPVVTLEEPTINAISPTSVVKKQTVTISISGDGFGPNRGRVSVGYKTLPDANILEWTNSSIRISWYTGPDPGTVTVHVYSKKAARSNGKTLEIRDK